MKDYNDKKEMTRWDLMDDHLYEQFLQKYIDMAEDREGIARLLGEEHPLPKLIEKALDTGDPEELDVAKAAYEALPEEVIHRVRHPWIGHPPPSGTREKLRKEQARRLVGEDMPGPDPVSCVLQIDARKGWQDEVVYTVDEDGHVLDPAIVYDLRLNAWPVRVQVCEGSDREAVLELLRKICSVLEGDWDRLTDPKRYLREPEDEIPF